MAISAHSIPSYKKIDCLYQSNQYCIVLVGRFLILLRKVLCLSLLYIGGFLILRRKVLCLSFLYIGGFLILCRKVLCLRFLYIGGFLILRRKVLYLCFLYTSDLYGYKKNLVLRTKFIGVLVLYMS